MRTEPDFTSSGFVAATQLAIKKSRPSQDFLTRYPKSVARTIQHIHIPTTATKKTREGFCAPTRRWTSANHLPKGWRLPLPTARQEFNTWDSSSLMDKLFENASACGEINVSTAFWCAQVFNESLSAATQSLPELRQKQWSISAVDVRQWTQRTFHLLENLEFGARNDGTSELIRFRLKIGNRGWTSLLLSVLFANSSAIRDSLHLWQQHNVDRSRRWSRLWTSKP